MSLPSAGAIAITEEEGATIVPLAWGFTNPAGPVQDETFEPTAALICALLSTALDEGPLDDVYIDLHGAGMVDSFPDAEAELLRRVRAVIDPMLPLAINLDPHANLTEAMIRLTDVVVPFRTYPYVDAKETGARTARLLLDRIRHGCPWQRVFRRLEFWIPLGAQCTLMPPMEHVMSERAAIAKRSDIVELAFCFGFPYARFPGYSPALAIYADSHRQADDAANKFLGFVNLQESRFTQDMLSSATWLSYKGRASPRTLRTDPSLRCQRARLLPQVSDVEALVRPGITDDNGRYGPYRARRQTCQNARPCSRPRLPTRSAPESALSPLDTQPTSPLTSASPPKLMVDGRMARGRCGRLRLHRMELASATPRRPPSARANRQRTTDPTSIRLGPRPCLILLFTS